MPKMTSPAIPADWVREAIAAQIHRGDLRSGDRLLADDIAQRLGCSHQDVLMALVELRREGLVEDFRLKGMRVGAIDPLYISHLYEIRTLLDVGAARPAAENGTSAQHKQLRTVMTQGMKARRDGNRTELIDNDMAFHMLIYKMTGNPLFAESAKPIWLALRRVLSVILAGAPQWEESRNDHVAIGEALLARDGLRAAQLLGDHVDHGLKAVAVAEVRSRK